MGRLLVRIKLVQDGVVDHSTVQFVDENRVCRGHCLFDVVVVAASSVPTSEARI